MESTNLGSMTSTYLEKSLDVRLPMETRIKYSLWHLRNVLHDEMKHQPLLSYDFSVLPANGPKPPEDEVKDG